MPRPDKDNNLTRKGEEEENDAAAEIPVANSKKRKRKKAKDIVHAAETEEVSDAEANAAQEERDARNGAAGQAEDQPVRGGRENMASNGASAQQGHRPPSKPVSVKSAPLLPWMRSLRYTLDSLEEQPVEEVVGMDGRIARALDDMGIRSLFPVQRALWHELVSGHIGGTDAAALGLVDQRDLCVCAPTGSGKTLAYVLPLCQLLCQRVVCRFRALVILPTRDLASQVKDVFDAIGQPLGLRTCLVAGLSSLPAESACLVPCAGDEEEALHDNPWGAPLANDPGDLVDIVVATPGRLMAHLKETRGFSLAHLQYLVVDETDRLLRQAYQDWLSHVAQGIRGAQAPSGPWEHPGRQHPTASAPLPCTLRRAFPEIGHQLSASPRVVKLLLSATLTRDPAKMAKLALHRPTLITSSAHDFRYKVPSGLSEYKLVCARGEKPVYLVALLQALQGAATIVFTASVEATHRLYLLLRGFPDLGAAVVEYSSFQDPRARTQALEAFRRGRATVLVASDAATRGLDVTGVDHVVSYDPPVYAKTYVHRVGRTARAGRPGCAYTLLRREEVRHFKAVLSKADNNLCRDYHLPHSTVEALMPAYACALEQLKAAVEAEKGATHAAPQQLAAALAGQAAASFAR